ncbi:IucA/IucC family protein [Pseudomonas sp. dw_358]|uniref:IucA/IucC family protein n=1 Tax=Pseudomonas sp. dw_358 TaxID=2720083 RepID=UPI001BD5C5E7|nr:IucA/IucC family protein [Pseudomonas sp. dw_358]
MIRAIDAVSFNLQHCAIDGDAQRHAIECLLNCYLREYALPRGEAQLDELARDVPMSLRQVPGKLVSVQLSNGRLVIRSDRTSVLGRCHFVSAPYFKGQGQGWRPLAVAELARLLCQPLGQPERLSELLEQVDNSLDITTTFLRHGPTDNGGGADSLLSSEQHQVWGHALHPTPKSREGVSTADLLACSPEVGAQFQLHWLRVDADLIRHQGQDPRSCLRQLSGREDLYPCHPWEVQRLLADPLVRKAIAAGRIDYLGAQGQAMFPTSSVRTLYHPDLDYFLKFSVHVRLTNCVRKNAWYELDSAVALTRLLAPLADHLASTHPDFLLMPEPAATALDLSSLGSLEQAREAIECSGILYRQNLDRASRERYAPQVAMALFTWDREGRSVCAAQLEQCAAKLAVDYPRAAERWLQAYAGILLDGILHCLFAQGVALEPHLQNTLVGFDGQGLPCRVWIRDLEGTKLVESHWPAERLASLDPRTRASLYYSPLKAWQRIAYCALVNNLGEAIFHLANGDGALESRLWRCVQTLLQQQCEQLDNPPLLRELCAGGPLPSKENFMTRLMMKADREAGYTALPNPMLAANRAVQP